jgi:uncharacterized protein (TIGR02594 family)
MKYLYMLCVTVLASCSNATANDHNRENVSFYQLYRAAVDRTSFPSRSSMPSHVILATKYLQFSEKTHSRELAELTGVNVKRTEWCAAFINGLLRQLNKSGSESVSDYPLTARSFMNFGIEVKDPKIGDIVVFPRGDQGWQGHVGIYVGHKK